MPDKPRLLLVDDDADLLRLLQVIFHVEKHYDTEAVVTGMAALESVRRQMPDVMLLDIAMPGMDGLEVCRTLKADPALRYIQIILVTAYAGTDDKIRGLDAGADDYVTKPYNQAELLARVRSAVRVKRLQDELRSKNAELKDLYQQLMQHEKMASVGLLAAGIAHEFNNIMTSVYGYAQLAKRDPKYKDQLPDIALQDLKRAMTITESMLTFSRRGIDIRKNSQLPELMDEILALTARELEQGNITIVKRYEPVPDILVNRGQIQQVFMNLLINARQAIQTAGTVTIRVYSRDQSVFTEVEDTGTGIPESELDKIFEPFYTTKGAMGGSDVPGHGLGLSFSRNIVNKHNGTIRVTSEWGKGATFMLQLPVVTDRRAKTEKINVESDRRSESRLGRRHRVLVVDDDVPVQNLLREFLAGHTVTCLGNGQAALEAIRQGGYDFVFLDVKMPGTLNGLQVFDAMESMALPRAPKVVFMTGFPATEEMEAYFERAYALIRKPFDMAMVRALLM